MNIPYRLIGILIGWIICANIHAQRYTLLIEDPMDIYKKERFGPNRTWYSYALIDLYGAGIPLAQGESGYSDMLGISWRIKHKLSRFMDHGLGMGMIYQGRRFGSDKAHSLFESYAPHDPAQPIPDWDQMNHHQMGLELMYFFRFQLQPYRGNVVGSCIDVGVHAGFIATEHSRFVMQNNTQKLIEKHHQLAYVERGYVDIELRYNYRFATVFSRYRVWSRIIDQSLQTSVFRPSVYIGLGYKL